MRMAVWGIGRRQDARLGPLFPPPLRGRVGVGELTPHPHPPPQGGREPEKKERSKCRDHSAACCRSSTPRSPTPTPLTPRHCAAKWIGCLPRGPTASAPAWCPKPSG